MREIIAIVILYAALQLGDINLFFSIAAKIVAFILTLYIFLCLGERALINKRRWFRPTPGIPQIPEFDDKMSDEENRQIKNYERAGKEKHYDEDGSLR